MMFDEVGPDCAGEQPGMEALQAWMCLEHTLADSGTYVCKYISGSDPPKRSFHAEGRAGDLSGYPLPMSRGALFLVGHAEEIGVQEVIYDRRIWRSTYQEWRKFTGKDPHTSHIHYAINWQAARRSTEAMLAVLAATKGRPVTQFSPEQLTQLKLVVTATIREHMGDLGHTSAGKPVTPSFVNAARRAVDLERVARKADVGKAEG